MEVICRICTESSSKQLLQSVFCANIMERLKVFINLEQNMEFPHQICERCVSDLNVAYDFKMKCLNSEMKIIKMLSNDLPLKSDNQLSVILISNDMCTETITVKEDLSDYVEISLIEKDQNPFEIKSIHNISKENISKFTKPIKCSDNDYTEPHKLRKNANHNIIKDNFFSYKCDKCSKEFMSQTLLEKHSKIHSTYKCPHCTKEFQKRSRMITHSRIHSTDKSSFVCPICSKIFTEAGNLSRHKRVHTGVRPFVCEICGSTFSQKTTLQSHTKTHDRLKAAVDNNFVEGFTCKLCETSFTSTRCLLAHLTRHHSGSINDIIPKSTSKRVCEMRNYKCTECQKSYLTKAQLKIHRASHLSIKPYLCEECGKTCITHSLLKSHMLIHSNVKPYKCEECGMTFRLQATLRIHFRQHSGSKPFTCDICAKSFRQMQHLKRHMRCHTGEKPFPCEICGKRFVDRNNVTVHMRQHTGNKPYKCQTCDMAFYDAPNLKKHTRKHEKISEDS